LLAFRDRSTPAAIQRICPVWSLHTGSPDNALHRGYEVVEAGLGWWIETAGFRGHQGWSHGPDSVATYSLAVTFEIVGQEIPIYEPLRAAVLNLQSKVEAETEVELEMTLEDDSGVE
jgi:hypothetical protein